MTKIIPRFPIHSYFIYSIVARFVARATESPKNPINKGLFAPKLPASKTVERPFDEQLFKDLLMDRVNHSKHKSSENNSAIEDLSDTYGSTITKQNAAECSKKEHSDFIF